MCGISCALTLSLLVDRCAPAPSRSRPFGRSGFALAAVTYVPIYMLMKQFTNPDGLEAADPSQVNWVGMVLLLCLQMVYVCMVYGPIAAFLVELFPTSIRYTSMSLPYHIGNGWFGGFLPPVAFAMVAATGDIYYGLWYPIAVALVALAVGLVFLPETFRRPLEH